ncbi:MAG TPA: hypothetical protein VFM18_11880 [Methanosarcina sp.]|nr:hypothetical protein [Methanosarcina sp.]
MDRQKLAQRQTEDIKILQKVNAANREAFLQKYPGQVEHCLRLTMERLQLGLDKRDNVDVNDVNTWKLDPGEIEHLAQTAYLLNEIRLSLND